MRWRIYVNDLGLVLRNHGGSTVFLLLFVVSVARLCYVFMCIFAYLSRNSSVVLALTCSRFAPGSPVTCTIPIPRKLIFVPSVCIMHACIHICARARVCNTHRSWFSYVQNSWYFIEIRAESQTHLRRSYFLGFANHVMDVFPFFENISKSRCNFIYSSMCIYTYVYTYQQNINLKSYKI